MQDSKAVRINVEQIQKHDIEANWKKAVNFVPANGQIIVYSPDENYNYSRFKVGDGTTNVNNLPFGTQQSDWNQNDETKADYVKNRTHGPITKLSRVIANENQDTLDAFVIEECIGDSFVVEFYEGSTASGILKKSDESITMAGGPDYYIGNLYWSRYYIGDGESLGDADNTGEDFCVWIDQENLPGATYIFWGSIYHDSYVDPYNIYHNTTTIKQLDEKYIPETIARKSDIAEQAQADWNQNDDTAPDYVQNRTHYSETTKEEYPYIAPYILTDLTSNDNGYYEFAATIDSYEVPDWVWIPKQYKIVLGDRVFYGASNYDDYIGNKHISDSTAEDTGEDYLFVNCGDYFYIYLSPSAVELGTTSLAIYAINMSENVHQLDEKYIPDTVARTTDVISTRTDINKVQSKVNTLSNNIIKEINGQTPHDGYVTIAYDDLANKPFGTIQEEQYATVAEFDGSVFDFLNTDSKGSYYLSQEVLGDEMYYVVWDGVETEAWISYGENEDGSIFNYYGDLQEVGYYIETNSEYTTTKIYSSDTNPHTIKLMPMSRDVVLVDVDKKLDEKFIPDTIARKSDVETAVNSLVDTAPDALNTLNELSKALGDDPNFATTVLNEVGKKVDKVDGKGLSTNDYTTVEKNKLDGIEIGAEKNVQPDWNQSDETKADYIKNRTHGEVFDNIPIGNFDGREFDFSDGDIVISDGSEESELYRLPYKESGFLTVVWDNEIYENLVTELWDNGHACVISDKGYIFANAEIGIIISSNDNNTHTIAMYDPDADKELIIKQLDEKFIPDTIARTSAIDALSERIDDISNTGGSLDVPLKKGTGKNSMIVNEGVAAGEGSVAGGTTDKSVLESVIGVAASLVNATPAEALAAMSLAFGANTKSITAGSSAIGFGNQGGVKGYYWDTIDFTTNTIKLSSTRRASSLINPTYVKNFDWHVGDIISMVNKNNYFARSVITAVDTTNSTITVDTLPFSEIQYDTIASIYTYTKPYDRTIYAVYQNSEDKIDTGSPRWVSRNGVVELGFGSYTLGVMNLSTGNAAFNTGYNNWAGGSFSFAAGRDNMAGYAAMVGGVQSKAYAYASLAYGLGVITKCSAGTALGQYNSLDNLENYLFVIGNGSSDTDRSNAFSVDKTGNVKAAGNIYSKGNKVATETTLADYAKTAEVDSKIEAAISYIENPSIHLFTQDFSTLPDNWNDGKEGDTAFITSSDVSTEDLTDTCTNDDSAFMRGGSSNPKIIEFTTYQGLTSFHFATRTSAIRYKVFNTITTNKYLTSDDIGRKIRISFKYAVTLGTFSCGLMTAKGTSWHKKLVEAKASDDTSWQTFTTDIIIDEAMVNATAGLLTFNLQAESEVYLTDVKCVELVSLEDAMQRAMELPDWDQNDENASDYIKNRTHYAISEIVRQTFSYDDLKNKKTIHVDSTYHPQCEFDLTQVTKYPHAGNRLIVYNIKNGEEEASYKISDDNYECVFILSSFEIYNEETDSYDSGYYVSDIVISAKRACQIELSSHPLDDWYWNEGNSINIPEAGIWVYGFYYSSDLTYAVDVIADKELKQLDDKFIPDTVVRKNELDKLLNNNLFDGNYVEGIDIGGSKGSLQYKITTAASRCSTIIMEVEPNTTYSIIKEKTGREGTASGAYYYFKLATATKLMTTDKEKFDGAVQYSITDKPTTNITFTTGPNDKYLYVMTSTNLKPFVQIVKGEQTEFTVSDYGIGNNKNKEGLTFYKWFDRAPRSSGTPSASACVPHIVIVDGKNTYHFAKDVDTSLNLNTWRWVGHKINGDVLWDKNEESLLWSVSDSEGVVKEAGADDFVGGYHGNEIGTGITILVDGELINESSFAIRRDCSNITLIVSSDIYAYGTSNVIFKRNKKLEFTEHKVKVSNTWNYIGASNLSIHTDLLSGLYSVFKRNLVGFSDNATNGFVVTQASDHDALIIERDNNLTEATFYGNNYSVTVKTTGKLPDTYHGSVKDFGTQSRYKAYLYNSVNEKTISTGDTLRGEFEIISK